MNEQRHLDVIALGSDAASEALRTAAFADVLRPSFTTSELADETAVADLPGRVVIVIVDRRDDSVVAAAVSDHDQHTGVTLLSYLAARPGGRSSGYGAMLMTELRQRWAAARATIALAEVHDARAWATTDDEDPVARLRFYARHDCGLLSVPWVQPSVGRGDRVRDMLLLVAFGPSVGQHVESAQLVGWVDGYFLAAEGAAYADPEFAALRRRFSDEPIVVLPIDAVDDVNPLSF